jgi:hypothetical protein
MILHTGDQCLCRHFKKLFIKASQNRPGPLDQVAYLFKQVSIDERLASERVTQFCRLFFDDFKSFSLISYNVRRV